MTKKGSTAFRSFQRTLESILFSVAYSDVSSPLPIHSSLPALLDALASDMNVVLQAPPGAGKSTGVPLALLNAAWLGEQKIVMLEPRRLAARAVATRMAYLIGEPVGRTIGYRTRLETKVSAATRVEVLTEGILTRWLQRDAALEGIGVVIFDEFHERSLNADLGLALCLDAQATLRPELRLLIMSATIDGEAIAKLLEAPVVTSEGRAFDVDVLYRERTGARSIWGANDPEREIPNATANVIATALAEHSGDILAFLPGQGEIRRVQRLLEEQRLAREIFIRPLYGDLSIEDQDAAIRPARPDERKIVLATNIAETSLTIEGIRVVVDSGWERRSRFDPATGMSRLESVRISRASAEQRRGRAGRLGPGFCYRLWSVTDHQALLAQSPPEIFEADLAPLSLELAHWGITDPKSLRWLDSPPAASYAQSQDLLRSLDAIEANGRITNHGRAMTRLSTHPRLAHMIVRAQDRGLTRAAIEIAAVLGERDLLRTRGADRVVDFRLRVDALRGERSLPGNVSVDEGAKQRALRSVQQLSQQNDTSRDRHASDDANVGRLLAQAYPDRIARSRGSGGRYLLSSGRGAQLPPSQSIATSEFLVIAEIDAGDRDAMVRTAAPIALEHLEEDFAAHIETRDNIGWDSREQAVVARSERWLGAVRLESKRLVDVDESQVLAAMLAGVREIGIAALPWTKEARALQSRLIFAARGEPAQAWPDVSDAALSVTLEDWLAPWLPGMSRRDHLARLDVHAALVGLLDFNQQRRLNDLVPTHLTVPSGSRIPIDYSVESPTVSVRLQEVFGLLDTPMIGGRIPLTLQLLSPAHRPVQITKDLRSFWARGYPDVKKELKGRYPKHHWPDDPLTAEPTARAKRRSP